MKILHLITFLILIPSFAFAIEATATLKNGILNASIDWDTNDTGEDVLVANLKFTPTKKTPQCGRISFIQTAKVEVSKGVDYQWSEAEGQANRNFMKTKASSKVMKGYFIDHDAIKCRKGEVCSLYYRDSWPNSDYSQDGMNIPGYALAASLHDAPFGWTSFESIRLEACAYCANDKSSLPLACMTWGGHWGITSPREILPIKFQEQPSPTFLEAIRLFQNFYKN